MSISERDLRSVFRFLHVAAEAPDGDLLGRPVLAALGELIPATLVEYFEIRADDLSGLVYTTSAEERTFPGQEEAFARYRSSNLLSAFRWQPAVGAVRLRELASERRLGGNPFYAGYLRPQGVTDQLKVWLSRSAATSVCVSLDRCDGVFSSREAAILEVLRPHLLQLHRAARAGRALARREAVLTTREAQVLGCALAGLRNAEIAAALFISPGTVRTHLENAYRKLGVRGRSHAAGRILGLPYGGAES